MNITDKVDDLLEKLLYCDPKSQADIDRARQAIRLAFKKQDRDTRHACAEAIAMGAFWSDPVDAYVIRKNTAHDIIMNCQGGIGCEVL